MATEYCKFNLYYLGTSTRWVQPPFSGKILLDEVSFRIKDGTSIPTTQTTMGLNDVNGIITFNSVGSRINTRFPLNDIDVLTCSSNRTGSINRYISNYSKSIFDFASYLGYPTSQNTFYWFALANDTMYAPFKVRYSATSIGSVYSMMGWSIDTMASDRVALQIKLIADDSQIQNAYSYKVMPYMSASNNNGNRYVTSYYFITKVNDIYYQNNLLGYYTSEASSDRQTSIQRYSSVAYTANEIAFLKNSNYVPDPYIDGETSTVSEGMTGTFDNSSDTIIAPSVPTLTTADAGFVRIYNPNISQLKSLAQYMWTDPNFLTTLLNHAKQLLENPIESIISLNLLPCAIPNSADEEVKVLFISTGVQMPPATTQFVEVDCGSLEIKEYYGSALDYSPYTKIHCYLPYIGQVTLDTDEVMNTTISIKYRIDIVTGMCVAMISVDGSILYQFSGHCSIAMPLTSADFSTYVSAAIGTAKAVAGIAAAGAGAGGVAAQLLGTAAPRTTVTSFDSTDTVRNPATGRQVKAGTHHEDKSVSSKGSSFGEMATAAAVNTVSSVMGSKTVVEHSGGFTGNSGYLAVRRPYLIIEVPRMCNPVDYGKFNGYPSMITSKLSDCKGFTKVQNIQLTGFSATNEEMSEIAEMLMGGVIF